MAITPLGALEDLFAITNDHTLRSDTDELRRRFQATVTHPLFQGMPGGAREWRTLDDDIKDFQRIFTSTVQRNDLLSADVVVETDDLVVFLLLSESIGEDGASIGRYQLLYCVARDGDEWKVAWLQWVGPA